MKHEILIFSDHHAHNFTYGATKKEHRGYMFNSRLLDSVNVIEHITRYVIDNKITNVLFLGDLFHKRSVLWTDTFNLTFEAIANLAGEVTSNLHNPDGEYHVHMIPGNHDFSNREGALHSLEPFKYIEGVAVWSSHVDYLLEKDLLVRFVPYSDNKETLKYGFINRNPQLSDVAPSDSHKLLVAHCGIQGAKVGSDYVLVHDGDVSVDDIPYDKFDACFFGHFHKHQQLFKNGWYVGATHQHNFGDVGCPRGFLHVTLEDHKVSVKHIETNAPKFAILDESASGDYSNCYVRLLVDVRTEAQKNSWIKKLNNPLHLEFSYSEDESTNEVTIPEDSLDQARMVQLWVDKNNKSEEYKHLGLELLSLTDGS